MIDRCRVCGYPMRRHYRIITYPDGSMEYVPGEIEVRQLTEIATLVCTKFEPTHHVEGVL